MAGALRSKKNKPAGGSGQTAPHNARVSTPSKGQNKQTIVQPKKK